MKPPRPGCVRNTLDPFELKKNIERKLQNFFTVLGNLDYEATKS